jgi:hypothetical protein
MYRRTLDSATVAPGPLLVNLLPDALRGVLLLARSVLVGTQNAVDEIDHRV